MSQIASFYLIKNNQQSAVQGVFRLGSRKTDIQIQFALTPDRKSVV